jgi:tetratricopeptide (TPR) repeat protein
MRLLHFDALDRLILTDFRGKSIPPYAILSHRWSGSEILIEDIRKGNYEEKEEGYRKLRFCADQVAQAELQYFWIDTCCIDRWDNNERSKAINSMFQWYRKAARCYVFLSDVSLSAVAETAACSDWEALFRASAWFTRGWTLQELIAPVSVEFFSREGRRIGDKASLNQLIHDITNIPPSALRNCPLDDFTTSERRRWAVNRRTTEEEDIVYCLLGVLGISMPTAYGEGQESARRRLQAEIEATGSAPSIVPFLQNESFVGRESQLAELEAKLFSNDQTTTTLAIVGPGGTGKSQLALEVAHRTRLNNKDCSVFWMDASDIDSLSRSYASVARKLSVPGCDDDQVDMKQLVKRCLVEISVRQCLLIFDNTEDTTLRSSTSSMTEAADLADFVPQSKLCSVIFTTTNIDTAWKLASRNAIALRELTLDAALRMLQARLARSLSNTEQQEAEHLLRELSYLPLAVMQAAACMKASGMTVQEYRSRLGNHEGLAIDGDDLPEGRLQDSRVKDPVAAALFLSINLISRDNALATDYLFFAACVDRKDISFELLEAASTQPREDALRLLDKYALITRRPAESAIDVHRLVHQALRKRLQVEGRLRQWTQRTTIRLLQVFPDDDPNNRSKWRRLLPHVQHALLHNLADDDNKRLDLASNCAMALYSDGRYDEAEELETQVMQTRKRVLGDEHPHTLTSMGNLALTYKEQGRQREAEELEIQVTKMRKILLGNEHPETLLITSSLASTYWSQGRWKDAEELQVQVMQTERVLGDERPETLNSMGNLALTYWKQGRWKDAEELQMQVLQTRKRLLGNEHHDTLSSMGNLALMYSDQGRWKEAEELQVQVLQIRKRVIGKEHPDTLTCIGNLALTYYNQGQWKEAEELQVQVLQIRKRVIGGEHPDTLAIIGNLASTYRNQGRSKEAEELETQVLQMRKKVIGEEHPDTLASMGNLALTYKEQGRQREAEELELQVMTTKKILLGNEHPETLISMHNLAYTLWSLSSHKEAVALMESCFQSCQQVLGEQHPVTQSSLRALDGWRADLREGPL